MLKSVNGKAVTQVHHICTTYAPSQGTALLNRRREEGLTDLPPYITRPDHARRKIGAHYAQGF